MKKAFKWLALLGCMSLSFGAGFMVAKKRFDNRDEQEIEEIKKLYEQKYKEIKPEIPKINVSDWESQLYSSAKPVYDSMVKDYTPEKQVIERRDIYVISPLEYGEDMSYMNESLTYYADGILANDDDDSIVDNIDDVVGIESLNHIGDYDEDYLYVKNDIVGAYYEVTKSDKTYSEATGRFI